jgi:hypothetical protein
MSGKIKALEVREDTKNKDSGSVVGNLFKGLVGGKTLAAEDVAPALEKLKDHLISKNVAAEVSSKICDSVAKKLEGKVGRDQLTNMCNLIFLCFLYVSLGVGNFPNCERYSEERVGGITFDFTATQETS